MKTFECMRIPSIKRYRISGAGTLHGDEAFKTGRHILDEYVREPVIEEKQNHMQH